MSIVTDLCFIIFDQNLVECMISSLFNLHIYLISLEQKEIFENVLHVQHIKRNFQSSNIFDMLQSIYKCLNYDSFPKYLKDMFTQRQSG